MFRIHPTLHDGAPALKLEGELTIYAAGEARREIAPHQASHPRLVLDLGGIEEIDSSGVQLLHWLKREAERRSQALVLVNPSEAALELFELLRVEADLGEPAPSGK